MQDYDTLTHKSRLWPTYQCSIVYISFAEYGTDGMLQIMFLDNVQVKRKATDVSVNVL